MASPPDIDPATADRLRRISRVMDSAITVPGTNFSFGLDPIIGVLPVAGDLISVAVSLYMVRVAAKAGVPKWKLGGMLGNIALDGLIGLVPLLGDAADFAFKANIRNLKLLGIDPR